MTRWAWYDGAWHAMGRLLERGKGDQRLAFACGIPVVTHPGWRAMDVCPGHLPRGPLCDRCYVPSGSFIGDRLDYDAVVPSGRPLP